MIQVGDKVTLGTDRNGKVTTSWGGEYTVLAVLNRFKNGKTAVKVNLMGKLKVFNV